MLFLFFVFAVIYHGSVFAQITSPGAISKFAPGGQYIMLTFSGGPHYIGTPTVLDILKQKKVKATFFVSGTKVLHHNGLLERMHKDGHEIGNSGYYSHLYTKLAHDRILSNVNETSRLISSITGTKVKHFRPPSGNTNAEINQLLKLYSMKVILWSLDSNDLYESKPSEITNKVLKKAVPGDIILMHDTVNQTINALPDVIDGLYKQGYEFLTITEVVSFPDDSPH